MNGSLSISHNVTITVLDGQHRIKSVTHKHNKANYELLTGIMKFLRGEFNPSNTSVETIKHNILGAKPYIPTHISFGDGFVTQCNDKINPPISTVKEATAKCGNLTANFLDTGLIHELVSEELPRIPISSNDYGSSSGTKDSFTLTLSTYIDKGLYKTSFYNDPNSDSYIPERQPIILSELGLFSSEYDGNENSYAGNLLAKVVFTNSKDDPVICQNSNDIILVKWEIIVSSLDDESRTKLATTKLTTLEND